jgi:hypothetical protein
MPGEVTNLEPGLGEVYAVVSPPSPSCARNGTCTGTTGAPQLWRTLPSSDDWSPDPAAGAVGDGLAVHSQSVWVENSTATADGPALGIGLLHSTDGGDHFVLEPEAIPGIACSYSPVSDSVVWSYCSGGHFMFAYLSTDAGAQFAAVGPSGPTQTTPNNYPNGSTLEAATPTTAVAADDLPGSSLIRTTNSGATWSAVQAPPDGTGTWSVIGFTTPEDGYAFWAPADKDDTTSTAQLWRTIDAGASWSPVTRIAA